MKLDGRVAIVTGGGRGIGQATALAFAREGANVVVSARTASEIEQVAEEVRALGRKALAIVVDVTKEDQIESMVTSTLQEFGKIDILVNNAGGGRQHMVADMPTEDWQYVLALNLTAPFMACRAVLPAMKRQGSGNIINISSRAARAGRVGQSAYCAAKAGLILFTMALAKEVKELGIRANAVLPGLVMTRTVIGAKLPPELVALNEKPWEPDVMADILLFLASDQSRGLTGRAIEAFGNWP